MDGVNSVMNAKSFQSILRVLPSFADFAFLVPLMLLFGRMDGLHTLFSDCDTGWHIRTGQWIASHRTVPMVDMFSYSRPNEAWFAWEWLSDLLFAGLNSLGGLQALAMFAILMLTVISLLLFRLILRKSNTIVAIFITVACAGASSIHWLARPHLFTLLFLILFYGALERVREGRTRLAGIPYLAILPVATILWTNLHGGFIAGIVMIGAYGCGEALRILLTSDDGCRSDSWRNAGAYFLSAAGCLAASLINPYTYHLHVHMVAYLRDPFNSLHIVEFLSPSFHHPSAIFFEVMLALGIAAAFSYIAKGRFTEALVILVWAHGALLAVRNVPIFMIAAAPPVAAAIHEWLNRAPTWNLAGWLRKVVQKFDRMAVETGETEAIRRWHLISITVLLLIGALIWAPNPPHKFRAEFDPKTYPETALATLKHDASARIFTNDEWGDYLIWSLYPSQKVFVDGRSDFYGDSFEEKYMDVLRVKYGWESTLESFGVDTVLMPTDAPLTGALKESRRWQVVYDDGMAVIFKSKSQTATNSAATAGKTSGVEREIAYGRPPRDFQFRSQEDRPASA